MTAKKYPVVLAEEHWIYSLNLIEKANPVYYENKKLVELMGYLYQQAFMHGYKHGK